MPVTVGDAIVYLKTNDKGLRRGLSQSERTVGGWLNNVGGKIVTGLAMAAATGAAAIGGALIAGAGVSVKTAISVESAWAGVLKTTEGLEDAQGNLTGLGEEILGGFRGLARELPTTVEELMAIGELGGQLGISEDQLLGFSRTIADLGETTNLSTDQAATSFARLANIMGTNQEDFDRMGSSVVELGNNFATTEADITTFAERIAGAGQIAGLTEADVFGIGAAMSSVGIEAEAGGTAVQKVLLNMTEAVATGGEELEAFAAASGLTSKEFADTFEQDAGRAFSLFVQNLGTEGDNAIAILDELGLKDQRLIRSFLSLANAGTLVEDAMGSSADAWEENTALATEAEKRYRTTESQIQMLKNSLRDMGITIGSRLLPFVNDLITDLKPLIDTATELAGIFIDTFIAGLEDGQDPLTAFRNALAEILPPELMAKLDPIITGIQTFIDQMLAFVNEHGEAIKGALLGIGAALIGIGIVAVITSVATALATLIGPVGLIIGLAALLGAAWTTNWGGIQEKTAAARDFLVNAFLFIKERLSFFISQWKLIFQAFSLAFQGDWRGFGEKLREVWDNAWKKIKEIGKNTFDTVKKFFTETDWGSLGEGILKGIAKGITGGLGLIRDAAIAAAKAALEAAKGFLGINTPSRLFMEQVGAPMAEGAALGFEGELDRLSGDIGSSLAALPALMGAGGGGGGGGDTIQHYHLSANYRHQSERSLRDTIRTLQMASGAG